MILVSALTFFLGAVLAAQYSFNPIVQAPFIASPENYAVPNRYIVVLKKDIISNKELFDNHLSFVQSLVKAKNAQQLQEKNQIEQIYDSVMYGYSAALDDSTLDFLRYSEDVDYIEQDKYTTLDAVQINSAWGLARISQSVNFKAPYNYIYNPTGGAGVNAYIIDSGVNVTHVDFEGRAVVGTVIPPGETTRDCLGHGTHVAGIVGSKTYGVAKKVNIIGVKVFYCNGTGLASHLMAGVNWAVNDHLNKTNAAAIAGKQPPKAVANISISSAFSTTLNGVVESAIRKGVFIIKSAGNRSTDACNYSPASSGLSFTVGAINRYSIMGVYSNFGKCVNIFAPGTTIPSTFIGSVNAMAYLTGTSMAAPHVCGVAAVVQSTSGFNAYNYTTLRSIMIGNSTLGAVFYPNNTANVLLYSAKFA